MVEALSLAGASLFSFCGMAWFALAKPPHWQQARDQRMPPSTSASASTSTSTSTSASVRTLHALGAAALLASLLLCLLADHATMAALVWVMLATASALLVTFTLSWRPHWLAWLIAWKR